MSGSPCARSEFTARGMRARSSLSMIAKSGFKKLGWGQSIVRRR